jgi:hypothetical protein
VIRTGRYLLFWFACYYPSGGWNDLEGDFENIEAAQEFVAKSTNPTFGDWQLIDTWMREDITKELR